MNFAAVAPAFPSVSFQSLKKPGGVSRDLMPLFSDGLQCAAHFQNAPYQATSRDFSQTKWINAQLFKKKKENKRKETGHIVLKTTKLSGHGTELLWCK